jgi:hypothetical protein
MKKNEIMPFAGNWMEVEFIMLSEKKDKYHIFYHMWNLKKKKRHKSRRGTIRKRKGNGDKGG